MFTLKASHIHRLAEINHFPLPDKSALFFGLRGCLPVLDDSTEFKDAHILEITKYNHLNPSCSIGQYFPKKGIAVFPGSTVPAMKHVAASIATQGEGTNMLLTGYHHDYRKGWHKKNRNTGHEAFRQDNNLPVRRTKDDLDYDYDDRVEYERAFDNIHAAWCMGVNEESFASAGCQVILGYPKCEKLGNRGDVGPWKTFKENAYSIRQQKFDYMLLNGRDARRVSLADDYKFDVKLRYGSGGDLVSEVQEKLKERQFYEGRVDGDFGSRTLRAVLEFQEYSFGTNADDGIVGPITASVLGISWPKV